MRLLSGVVSLLVAVVVVAVVGLAPAGAVDFIGGACQGAGANSSACNSKDSDGYALIGANGIIARATNIVALIAGVAAVILIIIGSFQFLTSEGDAGKVSAARKTVIYAIVGLVVIAVARTIIVFVVSRL